MDRDTFFEWLFALFFMGAITALGQMLASGEQLTPRIIVGRMLSSGTLAVGSASLIQFIPDINLLALVGISAVLASLGTSFLEKVIQSFLNKR